jgi:hypothetical protein
MRTQIFFGKRRFAVGFEYVVNGHCGSRGVGLGGKVENWGAGGGGWGEIFVYF